MLPNWTFVVEVRFRFRQKVILYQSTTPTTTHLLLCQIITRYSGCYFSVKSSGYPLSALSARKYTQNSKIGWICCTETSLEGPTLSVTYDIARNAGRNARVPLVPGLNLILMSQYETLPLRNFNLIHTSGIVRKTLSIISVVSK